MRGILSGTRAVTSSGVNRLRWRVWICRRWREGMNMVEEQDHSMNHRLGEEGMNMVGSHMVEVEDMDTVEEHFHSMNHRSEVDGMDTVDEHFHSMNH
jgi:hypothetical protein